MDQLPRELKDKIIKLSTRDDIPNWRLVARAYKNLADAVLFHDRRVVFHPDSFLQLSAVSLQPAIGPHIRTLVYEFDALPIISRDTYRGIVTQARLQLSEDQLEGAWLDYRKLYLAQEELRNSDFGEEELSLAMARLPKLRGFIMTSGHRHQHSAYQLRFFRAGIFIPIGNYGQTHSSGVPQLRALFRAAHNACVKLMTFCCHDVSWQLFQMTQKDLIMLATVLSEAHTISLELSPTDSLSSAGYAVLVCNRYLSKGVVWSLLGQIRRLKNLVLDFGQGRAAGLFVELKYLVSRCTWDNLRSVTLGGIRTTEDELVAFFERHSYAIRGFQLREICLTVGEWNSTLTRIRDGLYRRARVEIKGDFIGDDPSQLYEFFGSSEAEKRRLDLEHWYKYQTSGDCPLDYEEEEKEAYDEEDEEMDEEEDDDVDDEGEEEEEE